MPKSFSFIADENSHILILGTMPGVESRKSVMRCAGFISGSNDASIREPVYNDIVLLIGGRPIEKVLCNGMKAYKLCLKLKLPLAVLYMPSTSPANAAWSVQRLTAAWKPELTNF